MQRQHALYAGHADDRSVVVLFHHCYDFLYTTVGRHWQVPVPSSRRLELSTWYPNPLRKLANSRMFDSGSDPDSLAACRAYGTETRRASILDYSIVYIAIGGLGIGAWLLWNWAIFKNPLYFQDGQFGKPSLWVSSTDPVTGNWLLSFKTYWYAISDTETWPLLAIASIGLAVFCLFEWRTELPGCCAFTAGAVSVDHLPFFVICLYKGQRPMDVPQVEGDFYNVRFGLMMLMPAAVFIGYLPAAVGKLVRSSQLCISSAAP